METRAPSSLSALFVLAAIAAVFGFVYWLHNTGGLGPRATYHVQFDGSVPGLLVGAAVLFNGIRVGEVTDLGLAPDSPRRVNATLSVASTTPVRSDTKVGLEFQGLTGVPGGRAGRGKAAFEFRRGDHADCRTRSRRGHDASCAQRVAAGRLGVGRQCRAIEEHHRQLAGFLRRAGAQHWKARQHRRWARKMTGGGEPVQKVTYDLRAAQGFAAPTKTMKGQLSIPEPTAWLRCSQTQRMLFSSTSDVPGFAEFIWEDTVPYLF